jgi:hypothetical protein
MSWALAASAPAIVDQPVGAECAEEFVLAGTGRADHLGAQVLGELNGDVAGDRGAVLVADMKVGERFASPGDLVERLMYGFSPSVCPPDSMSHPGSAATGTAMRPDTFRRYAELAGFATVDTLDVDHDFWRFYRLHAH